MADVSMKRLEELKNTALRAKQHAAKVRSKVETRMHNLVGAAVVGGSAYVGGVINGAFDTPSIAGVPAVGGVGALAVAAGIIVDGEAGRHLASAGSGLLASTLAEHGRRTGLEMAGSELFRSFKHSGGKTRGALGEGDNARSLGTGRTQMAGMAVGEDVQRDPVMLKPSDIRRAQGQR